MPHFLLLDFFLLYKYLNISLVQKASSEFWALDLHTVNVDMLTYVIFLDKVLKNSGQRIEEFMF